jgi:hypothetical protein
MHPRLAAHVCSPYEMGDLMTRGIFDPNSENVMKGAGNDFLGDPGIDRSKMPPSLVDGDVETDDELDVVDDELQPEFNDDPAAAADSLMHIEVEDEGQVEIEEDPKQME